jgi:hypothetical protein
LDEIMMTKTKLPLLILPMMFVMLACMCTSGIEDAKRLYEGGRTLQAVAQDPTLQALVEQAPQLAGTAQAALQDPTVQAMMEQVPGLAETAQAVLKDPTAQAGIQAALTAGAGLAVGTNNSPFVATNDANILSSTAEMVVFTTNLSLSDVARFYRDELAKQGLTERTTTTYETDTTLSLLFDGAPNGKTVSVQAIVAVGQTTVTLMYINN